MERWSYLLGAHDYIFRDRRWPLQDRLAVCRLFQHKMLEIGDLRRNADDIRLGELLEIMRNAK